jgi:hypothetical protein
VAGRPATAVSAPADGTVAFEAALDLLAEGEIKPEGLVPWSSNATFLVTLTHGGTTAHAIYKPARGERPLWDFPSGTLCKREMAAFVVSEALGWRLVPPTVLRDGPYGPGAVQLFIPHDPDEHYLALAEPSPVTARRIAAFDVVVNNADRKAGHVLHAVDGAFWAIDHGVCFHAEPKLRTVIWEFAGQRLPDDLVADVRTFVGAVRAPGSPVRETLAVLLSPTEMRALARRAADLVKAGRFPAAEPGRRSIPWPPV